MHDLVALPHVLVRAYDEAQPVGLAEGGGHVGAELGDVLSAARVVHAAPHRRVRVGRVGPQRVQRHELSVRVVQRPRQLLRGRLWAQAQAQAQAQALGVCACVCVCGCMCVGVGVWVWGGVGRRDGA